jgi:hypothetical protein
LYSPAKIVYLGRYFLEPLFRLLGTMMGIRQQYPPVFSTQFLNRETPHFFSLIVLKKAVSMGFS